MPLSAQASDVAWEPTPRRSRRSVLTVSAMGLAVLTLVGLAVLNGSGRAPAAAPPPGPNPIIQGPAPSPATVRLGDGSTLTCPLGAVPAVVIERLGVVPSLSGGTTLRPGRYRVQLSGSVLNEADRAVRVRSVGVTVGGRPWPARVHAPASLPAHSKAPLSVSGTLVVRHRVRPRFATTLSWRWVARRLAPCGQKGLAVDD